SCSTARPLARWARAWTRPRWCRRLGASGTTRDESAGRSEPHPDPVPALVPDPGEPVLDLSAPAAGPCAAAVRRGRAAGGAGGVRGQPVLVAPGRRPGARPHVAADPRHRAGLRRVPGGHAVRGGAADAAVPPALSALDQSRIGAA